MKQKHLFKMAILGILLFSFTACSPTSMLSIEEHAIKTTNWEGEELTFDPLEGTREEILAKHEVERSKPPMTFTPPVKLEGDSLNVVENFRDNQSFVEVYRNDRLEMSIAAGVISPINNFKGIWVLDGRWILEVAHVEENPVTPNAAFVVWGEIIHDGESLNEKHGYDEAFDFQILNGNPFYFFRKDGVLGFSYDGEETLLGYSAIPHYQCCSGAAFNPHHAENMVAFYTSKDEQDFYVEIGAFD